MTPTSFLAATILLEICEADTWANNILEIAKKPIKYIVILFNMCRISGNLLNLYASKLFRYL